MLKHISKAARQGHLVSWLHYTISFSPYHQEVTDALQRFLKWNLDIVADSQDFPDIDCNILIVLLQQNDLVLSNEYVLFRWAKIWYKLDYIFKHSCFDPYFRYIQSWLLHKITQIQSELTIADDQKQMNIHQLIESIVVHIRFAMMSPQELSQLLLQPIVKMHTEYFSERTSIGMSYQSGQDDLVAKIRATDTGQLQFTPRLYTSDTYSLSMDIPYFEKIENYQTFCACFFSQITFSEYHRELHIEEGKFFLFKWKEKLVVYELFVCIRITNENEFFSPWNLFLSIFRLNCNNVCRLLQQNTLFWSTRNRQI